MTAETSGALASRFALLICALVTLGAAPGDTPTTWQPELTHSYEQALAKLASNDFTGALNSLLELESRASASLTSSSLLELDELEMKAIESLLPAGTEILLPVIVLHQEAYRQLRQQYLDTSAFRSRSMAMKLSDLYVELEPRRETATIASDLFASLAGLFRETSAGSTGLDLFRRSLTYDRTNEAALLGTAVAYEQRAMYKEALSFLKRCLEVHPENTEAQLRLAINLDRLGQHAQAIGTLEALLTREAPDWQISLAYQELTRMLLARDKLLGAEAMAQRGLERFPRDSTLRIMFTHISNLRGSDSGLPRLKEFLGNPEATDWISPRFLYGQDPELPLKKVDLRLRLHASRSLAVLARALSTNQTSDIH